MKILEANAYPTLAQLLKSDNIPLVIPVVGVIEECAKEADHRAMTRELNMVPDIVEHCKRDDKELQVC